MSSTPKSNYTAEPIHKDGELVDIVLHIQGKKRHLSGRGGPQREIKMLDQDARNPEKLPVFLGTGLGRALETLLEERKGRNLPPVVVIDKETPIQDITGTRDRFKDHEDILYIDTPEAQTALRLLTEHQLRRQGAPFAPVIFAPYLGLDREYYGFLAENLKASSSFDFWDKAKYPKFQNTIPRILLITSKYFLMGEVIQACKRLNVPHHFIQIGEEETLCADFVERLLEAVVTFKPDFVFTINHLGVDREGVLIELLERLELPLASWFVDNPHLILYLYNKLISKITAIYTWDTDNIDSLKAHGFYNVEYLPLGTDVYRFRKPESLRSVPKDHPWYANVSFVGNSMQYKIGPRMKAGKFPRPLLVGYKQIARDFGEHDERSVRKFLSEHHPDLFRHFEALDTAERQLAYEAMVTWEATRQYRQDCVRRILDFNPLIAGDKGWRIALKNENRPYRLHHELNYYDDLPNFYPLSKVNFNCTSKQMKGAVNQRVFDVPATGSFVLTDHRVQIEQLFEPEKEVVYYRSPDEIPDLTAFYLKNEAARNAIVNAARRRILAEHTYEHRLQSLMDSMRRIFG